jgi:hypothetical protein
MHWQWRSLRSGLATAGRAETARGPRPEVIKEPVGLLLSEEGAERLKNAAQI